MSQNYGSNEKAYAQQIVSLKKQYDNLSAKGWDTSGVESQAQEIYSKLSETNPYLSNSLQQLGYDGASQLVNSYNWQTTPLETATENNTFIRSSAKTGLDNLDKMYTDSSYGQEIRDAFKAYGKSEGSQAAASSAASNGGNFDSFAQYNKDNTQLAYNVAAENAIEAKRSGYADNYFLKGIAATGQALNESAGNLLNYDYNMQNLATQEKINSDMLASQERIKGVTQASGAGNSSGVALTEDEIYGTAGEPIIVPVVKYSEINIQDAYNRLEELRPDWESTDNLNNEWAAYLNLLESYIANSAQKPTEDDIKQHMSSNFKKYTIDRDKATQLCEALGIGTAWLGAYKNVGENYLGFLGEWGNTYLEKIDGNDASSSNPNNSNQADTINNNYDSKTDSPWGRK